MSTSTPDLTDDKETLSFIEESVSEIDRLTKLAAAQEAEIHSLRAEKAALEKQKVVLEKVATASPFGQREIDEIMSALKPSQFVRDDEAEKVAEVLKADPVNVVKLIRKMANSLESHSYGHAVPPTGETTSGDPDGWDQIGKAS